MPYVWVIIESEDESSAKLFIRTSLVRLEFEQVLILFGIAFRISKLELVYFFCGYTIKTFDFEAPPRTHNHGALD